MIEAYRSPEFTLQIQMTWVITQKMLTYTATEA